MIGIRHLSRTDLAPQGIAARVAVIAFALVASPASAFLPEDRWAITASGSTGGIGRPATITWGIVPDGVETRTHGASGLVQQLDASFDSLGAVGPLSERPWFPVFESAFRRWGELSGVTFVYEPNDDGQPHAVSPGVLGTRGDIRIAGASVDGLGGSRAFGSFPPGADIVIDLDDAAHLLNPVADYLRMRNALMHEIGHGLGLGHVVSFDAEFLMEPRLTTGIDGPQFDDIRGVHYLYGDALEKAHGVGNDTRATATPLGRLRAGGEVFVGAAATDSVAVAPGETDFVSIANAGDFDYFSFEVDGASLVSVRVTPAGGSYHQGLENEPQSLVDARASSNLRLAVLDASGLLFETDAHSFGDGESIEFLSQPSAGQYFVRVRGSRNAPQMYQLSVSVESAHAPEPSSVVCAVIGGMVFRSISGDRRPRGSRAMCGPWFEV